MSVFDELKQDLVRDDVSLMSILRRAKILAVRLGDEGFEQWIDNELAGYNTSEELPPYRQGETISCGNFMNPFRVSISNAQIPTTHLPDEIHEYATTLRITQGVGALTNLLQSQIDEDTIKLAWPTNLSVTLSDRIYQGFSCVSAYHMLPKNFVNQLLDDIRTRLLNFVLSLEKQHPELVQSEDELRDIPREEVANELRINIYGGSSTITQSQTHAGNKQIGDTITVENSEQSVVMARGATGSGITQLRQLGNPEIADALEELAGAIKRTDETQLRNELKDEALELVQEIARKAASRDHSESVLKSLAERLGKLVDGIQPLTTIVSKLWTLLGL